MSTYLCTMCDFRYSESRGFPRKNIPPGTEWSQIPDNWTCPVCGSPKNIFKLLIEAHFED